jgi:hypothetical protein
MSISILSPLALGLVLGLKHALDADHLAAVSTMATELRGLFAFSLIGAVWGLGHTLSLVAAGVLVIVFHVEIGEHIGKALELCVGFMLIALGGNSLHKLARSGKSHMHTPRLGARPLLVGVVHRLAGSAALTLLVLAAIPSPARGLHYIAIFGTGSTSGMVLMSTLFSLPARLTSLHFARANIVIHGLAGIVSELWGLHGLRPGPCRDVAHEQLFEEKA